MTQTSWVVVVVVVVVVIMRTTARVRGGSNAPQ
jgi:hypothetical protein